jgi:hypothetical protein
MKSLPPCALFLMLWIASTTLRNPHPQRENSPSSSGVLTAEAAAWMGSSSSTLGSTSSKSYLSLSQKKNGVGGVDFGSFLSIHSGARTSISRPRTLSPSTSLVMYFDDISRQHHVQQWTIPLISGSSSIPRFFSSYTEAKQQALQHFLGYSNAESTRHLSNEQGKQKQPKFLHVTSVLSCLRRCKTINGQ